MNNEEIKEAIETLERNYPFDRYVQLKKAVDVAIEALHTVNSPIRTMMRLGEFQADAIMQSSKDTDVPDDDSISRQDAIDMVYGCEDEFGKDVILRLADYIRQLPSVQPKPDIIACGDCKHWICHDKRCGYWNHGVKPLDWCCHGERRTDEGD